MKIIVASYNTCFQNASGGVQVRIRRIHDLLVQRGIEVDYYKPFETKLEDYDVLHVFKLNMETAALIKCAKTKGLKIVLSSIVNVVSGYKIDFYKFLGLFPIATTYRLEQSIMGMCDAVIAETYKEREFIRKHYNVDANKIYVVPNGIDEQYDIGDEIFQLIGKRIPYVLQVGRIDENKNLLNVIRAVKNTEINLVVIGGPDYTDTSLYYERCREEAKECDNIFFLGWINSNSKELNSAYKNADALILPSFHETFGLVAVEAAAYGTRVCVSDTLPILDFDVFDKNLSFVPRDVNSIKRALCKAISIGKDYDMMKKARSIFSWTSVIEQHIQCYEKVCNIYLG